MGYLRIVAGSWGRRRLRVPRGHRVRPTPERVREAWMNMLGPELAGASVLDLFAGSGALGLEALSRGAARVTFVETDARALECLRANIEELGAGDRSTVVRSDVFGFLGRSGPELFDIALADPPYGTGAAAKLIERYGRRPFARVLSVEHGYKEEVALPAGAIERRYGDTVLVLIYADDLEEEEEG